MCVFVAVRVPVPPGRPWIPLSRPNKNIPSCECSPSYLYYNYLFIIKYVYSFSYVLECYDEYNLQVQ